MNVKLIEISAVKAVSAEKQKAENSLEQLKNIVPELYGTVKSSLESFLARQILCFSLLILIMIKSNSSGLGLKNIV